ncbi:hypothetical protein MY11210_002146 [Beauveria gryllotalpidicola]
MLSANKLYDEISEIRQAAKKDFSMSNAKKREIAEQYTAAREEPRRSFLSGHGFGERAPTTTNAQRGLWL